MTPLDRMGGLRMRLALQTRTVTFNDLRQPEETWATTSYWRANRRPVSGRDAVNAQQRNTTISDVFEVRHPGRGSEFSPEQRLVDTLTGDVFNVVYTSDPDGRGQYLSVYTLHRGGPREQVSL